VPKSVKSKLSHAATEQRVSQAGKKGTISLECHVFVFFFTAKNWRRYLCFLEVQFKRAGKLAGRLHLKGS
jgi:hypothetical protein